METKFQVGQVGETMSLYLSDDMSLLASGKGKNGLKSAIDKSDLSAADKSDAKSIVDRF